VRGHLLVDHGSRNDAANRQLEELTRLFGTRIGAADVIAHAHLELAPPDIPTAIAELAASQVTELIVHPVFLASGRHVEKDIPAQVEEAVAKSAMSFHIAPPLGVDDLLVDLLLKRADEVLEGEEKSEDPEDAGEER